MEMLWWAQRTSSQPWIPTKCDSSHFAMMMPQGMQPKKQHSFPGGSSHLGRGMTGRHYAPSWWQR